MRDLDATWTGVFPAATTRITSDQALDLEAASGPRAAQIDHRGPAFGP
jgi:hypothetical protein